MAGKGKDVHQKSEIEKENEKVDYFLTQEGGEET